MPRWDSPSGFSLTRSRVDLKLATTSPHLSGRWLYWIAEAVLDILVDFVRGHLDHVARVPLVPVLSISAARSLIGCVSVQHANVASRRRAPGLAGSKGGSITTSMVPAYAGLTRGYRSLSGTTEKRPVAGSTVTLDSVHARHCPPRHQVAHHIRTVSEVGLQRPGCTVQPRGTVGRMRPGNARSALLTTAGSRALYCRSEPQPLASTISPMPPAMIAPRIPTIFTAAR